jgi:hypothetical protein
MEYSERQRQNYINIALEALIEQYLKRIAVEWLSIRGIPDESGMGNILNDAISRVMQELRLLGYPEHDLRNIVYRYDDAIHDYESLSQDEQYLVEEYARNLMDPSRERDESEITIITQIRRLFSADVERDPFAVPVADPYSVRYIPRMQPEECYCSVCFLEATNTSNPQSEENMAIARPCGHCFHLGCIRTWLDRALTCPNCRTGVEEIAVFYRDPTSLIRSSLRSARSNPKRFSRRMSG